MKFVDQIIILSGGIRNYFIDTYGRRTMFIPNGVNRSVGGEPGEIRKRWGLGKDSYIPSLRRFVPEKGLRYLVEACKGLKMYKKLVVAGGGSDMDAFAKELRQSYTGLEDSATSTGFIQGETLDELYGNCYLYVFPSDLEGVPLSLLEAISYGSCYVVSGIKECKSMITGADSSQNAAVFRRNDVGDLAGKLRVPLGNDTLIQRYKDEAVNYICKKYGWGKVIEETVGVYRKAGAGQ